MLYGKSVIKWPIRDVFPTPKYNFEIQREIRQDNRKDTHCILNISRDLHALPRENENVMYAVR